MAMATMLSVMDAKTTAATWYMVDRPRGLVKKVVLSILTHGARGEFVIRARGSEADVLALSVRDPVGELTTAIIEYTDNEFTLRGTDERFETLDALVAVRLSATYYCERPRLTLGVQLVLPGPHVIQLLAMDAASTAPAADRNSVDYLEAMENTGSYVMVEPYAASTGPAADRSSVDYLEAMGNTGSYATIEPDV